MNSAIRRHGLKALIDDSMALGKCFRCSEEVPQADLFSENKPPGEGRYAILGQVVSETQISGGMLCGKCSTEFSNWWRSTRS